MKKIAMMIWLSILMISCGSDTSVNEETTVSKEKTVSEFQSICEKIENDLVRCENKESVCYKYVGYRRSGLQCYFKQAFKIKDGLDALSTNNTTSN